MARDSENREREREQSDYQVFLSFRGCDTRQGFADCLYHFLTDAGVRVFRDNEELRPGHKIEEVLTAINRSLVCIPILSKGYANSKWCLLELTKMVELEKEIMPIFYKVEADDVKLKTELYSDDLSRLGKEYDAEKVEWERALKVVGGIFDQAQLEGTFKEVGRIKAWTIMDYPGYGELCKVVVNEVVCKLEVKHKILEGELVGIDDHVEAIRTLLDIESPDVRCVVIHGVGGVGKTTLSKVVFNQLCDSQGGFLHCCFLDNVRETANHHGVIHLQNKLLRLLGWRNKEIDDIDRGKSTIKDILKNKKVLIILDDLNQQKQIECLIGDSTWFGSGSRIIITTRDPSCVTELPNVQSYDMSTMSSDHALRLFSRYAFEEEFPPVNCLGISKEVVAACGRLPLALEVMGSYLRHVEMEQWKSKLKVIASQNDIQEKLMISFKNLDSRTKEIFLDIACFFVGSTEREYAVHMWEACDLHPEEGLKRLLSMSLVKISEDNTFWMMHDLLRDLGREIVIQENLTRPEKRSRLWSSKEVERVLSREKGTSKTDLAKIWHPKSPITANQIRPLQNLRFLEVSSGTLEGDFGGALRELKWLSWHDTSLMMTNLVLEDLVILDLSSTNITDEWLSTIQVGENLRVLKISDCLPLKKVNLIKTQANRIWGFKKFPKILGNLTSLVELDISCMRLKNLPKSIGNMENLRMMKLNCSAISELPNSICNLENLKELHAANSALKYIPENIGRLHQLRTLNMSNSAIHELPNSICNLENLEELHAANTALKYIPEKIGQLHQLKTLNMSNSAIHELPNSICNLEKLEELHAANSALKYIPEKIGKLHRLRTLNMSNSAIHQVPSTIDKLCCLNILGLEDCDRIQELPNLPPNLTILRVSSKSLRKLPNLTNLKSLTDLLLCGDMDASDLPKEHLSSTANWIGSCLYLESFKLAFRGIACIEMETSAFPRLQQLHLCCPDVQVVQQLPLSLARLELSGNSNKGIKLPTCLRNMEALTDLQLSQCILVGDVPLPRNLKSLYIIQCSLLQPLLDLSELKMLESLYLSHCKMLRAVRGIENMNFPPGIRVFDCPSLKEISDFSKFEIVTVVVERSSCIFKGARIVAAVSANPPYIVPPEIRLEELSDEEFNRMW